MVINKTNCPTMDKKEREFWKKFAGEFWWLLPKDYTPSTKTMIFVDRNQDVQSLSYSLATGFLEHLDDQLNDLAYSFQRD